MPEEAIVNYEGRRLEHRSEHSEGQMRGRRPERVKGGDTSRMCALRKVLYKDKFV